MFSGFDADAFAWARGVFQSMGFAPVMGGGGGGASPGPVGELEPGRAVGVSLVEGDLDLSVSGTVTHIDHDRVYAFGHPFYNLGPTQFPLKKAWVHAIFPSLQVSWKIASTLDAVGTLDQDRTTAVSGRLGPLPRMIPVEVRLRSPRASERVFRFRMVEDELLTPLVAYASLLSVLQGHERAFGAATLRLEAQLTLAGGREVRFEDVVASEQPAAQAAAVVAGPLALLSANDFEKVAVERSRSRSTPSRAARRRRWCAPGSTRRCRCGPAASCRCACSCARGAARRVTETLQGRGAGERHRRQLHAARGRRQHDGRASSSARCARPSRRATSSSWCARSTACARGNRIYARLTRAGGRRRGGRRVPAGASRPRCSRC